MTFGATISRKKALDAATKAVDKADELTTRHNETIAEVGKIRSGLTGLQEHTTKRLDAQLRMIEACEKRTLAVAHAQSADVRLIEKRAAENHHHVVKTLADEQRAYVDRADVRLARMIEAHQQMGFWARVNWIVTGRTPDIRRGMVSAEIAGRVDNSSHADLHETPRRVTPTSPSEVL